MSSQASRSSDLAEHFPGLAAMASRYVTNSWDYQFGEPEEAVKAFAEDHPELTASASGGVAELLAVTADELERLDVLDDLGWGYAPRKPRHLDRFLRWVVLRLGAGDRGWDTAPVAASSYPDLPTAEACATAIVRAHLPEVEAFVAGPGRRCRPLRLDFEHVIGSVVARDGFEGSADRAVLLVHNDDGYPLVHSTYPELPRPSPPQLPALEVLFGAYFYADWFDEDDEPIDVVHRFAADEPAHLVAAATAELRTLTALEDLAVEEQVHALGSYFLPRPDGQLRAFLGDAITLLGD